MPEMANHDQAMFQVAGLFTDEAKQASAARVAYEEKG